MSSTALDSERQISNILRNKMFTRQSEKTQVTIPRHGQAEVVRNRLIHCHEVASAGAYIAAFIDYQNSWASGTVDYQGSIKPAGLLHDIGNPAFGHAGARILDEKFKSVGGFDDNNNNLVIITKNKIMVSNYTLASVIKYPDRLYQEQVELHSENLKQALDQDVKHFSKFGINLSNQKRTIACQVMDIADTNTYCTSDLTDFLCLGNTIDIDALRNVADRSGISYRYSELGTLMTIIQSGDKSVIKAYFNQLNNRFCENYRLSNNGIVAINEDLERFRSFLWEIELEYYIKPIDSSKEFKTNISLLGDYVDKVVKGGFMPSRYYKNKVVSAKSESEKMLYMRDMIGEATYHYILNVMGRSPHYVDIKHV
jgi:dGTP triphosphohydrolase